MKILGVHGTETLVPVGCVTGEGATGAEALTEAILLTQIRVKTGGRVGSPSQGVQTVQGTSLSDLQISSPISGKASRSSHLTHRQTGPDGRPRPAGPCGRHCPQMFRTITPGVGGVPRARSRHGYDRRREQQTRVRLFSAHGAVGVCVEVVVNL